MESAKKVFENTGWTGADIDVLVFASGYHSAEFPATGFIVQKLLGIKEDCLIYDINLACTGTVDGLYTLAALLQQMGAGARGLLLVGETPTIGGAADDKSTSMLSSDCGAAVALKVENSDGIYFAQKTDGTRYKVLVRQDIQDYIHMDGMEVFQFAITDVVQSIKEFFNYFKIENREVDYFIIHQAQKFIVDKVALFSGFPKEKILNSYQWYGNTGGASDICTLCANKEILLEKDKIKVFMTGFGAGLSWGMVVFSIWRENIVPVNYLSTHYEI